jgi:hypothetical protein
MAFGDEALEVAERVDILLDCSFGPVADLHLFGEADDVASENTFFHAFLSKLRSEAVWASNSLQRHPLQLRTNF